MLTGVLTLTAALSYGELAAMMPRAGGQYVYLREAFSPLWGFLYGWTLFLVIQTGTIAAVAVAFARYLGVLIPWISDGHYLMPPVHITTGYALSLSTTQFVGLAAHRAADLDQHARPRTTGAIVQNVFTVAKTGALLGLVAVGLLLGLERDGRRRQLRAHVDGHAARSTSRPASRRTTSSGCSSRWAWPRPARCSRRTPGTTSRSRPAR